MSPITHFLAGWALAERFAADRRSRLFVTLVGVVPDLDGLGVVIDSANRVLGRPESDWFSTVHHFLLHGLFGALLALGVCVAFGARRWSLLFLILLSYHLHLLCDLVGSRGPIPGEIWPIQYWAPFTRAGTISWSGQWALNAWPNIVLTIVLLVWALARAVRRGFSPVSLFSPTADAIVVATLRQRWHRFDG